MDVYICITYYHLLVSLAKNIKLKQQNDLVLCEEVIDNVLISNKELIQSIIDSGIFRNIYLFDFSKNNYKKDMNKIIKFYKKTKRMISIKNQKIVDFKKYRHIYIFNDATSCGMYLNMNKFKYRLLEDGTNNYTMYKPRTFLTAKEKFRNALGFKFPVLATSEYIEYIEVNQIEGVIIKNKKLKEFSKKKLFDLLNEDEKNKIFRIFIKNFNDKQFKNSALLITQPLSEDMIVQNEMQKVSIYKKIINKYISDNLNLIIKIHPRETTDYKKYFENVYLMDKHFPLEILSFCKSIKIASAVTITSTSIFMLDCVDEKIFLGEDWIIANNEN